MENASIRELVVDIAILLITGAMLIPAGLWIFNRAEIYAKKHGKLKRSG
ncbi:MAG: hypothetical protein ONB13_11165 [candidate division KSB1 bacterium]|nr:hypothetical protein [candidate division KSB1 bacterium]